MSADKGRQRPKVTVPSGVSPRDVEESIPEGRVLQESGEVGSSSGAATQAIPLYELMGAASAAVVKADAMAARATADYIAQVGFEPSEPPAADFPDHLGRVRTVTFQYEKTGMDGIGRLATLKVPLLSLVPIPMLAIREAVLEIEADLEAEALSNGDSEGDAKVGFENDSSVRLMATLNPKSQDGRDSGNLKVKITLEPSDVPDGTSRLLNLMRSVVQSHDDSAPKENP